MVTIKFSEIKKLPPQERIKALKELEKKKKESLKKQEQETEKVLEIAGDMLEDSLDEVAIEEELRQAREELKKIGEEELPEEIEEKEEDLEELVKDAPKPDPSHRMYGDVLDTLNDFNVAGGKASSVREVYAALQNVHDSIAGTEYAVNPDDKTHDIYKSDVSPEVLKDVWEKVQGMPDDEFHYKDRMESVLDSIYEAKKQERDSVYRRADH